MHSKTDLGHSCEVRWSQREPYPTRVLYSLRASRASVENYWNQNSENATQTEKYLAWGCHAMRADVVYSGSIWKLSVM